MAFHKVDIPEEDDSFIKDYKAATGLSIQVFVLDAIKEKILRIEAENTLEDEKLLNS